MAALLGYEPLPEFSAQTPAPPPQGSSAQTTGTEEPPVAEPQPSADVPFWRVEGYEAFEQKQETLPPPLKGPVSWSGRPPVDPARYQPLSTWRELLPRLRRAVAEPAEGGALDIDAIVRHLSRGERLMRLPRRKRRRWGSGLQIIDDRSTRLTPFWQDQDLVTSRLRSVFPRQAVEYARWWDGRPEPVFLSYPDTGQAYRLPPAGTLVVVLGDLGCLARDPQRLDRDWDDFGRRLQEAGCRTVALTPCPPARWAPPPLRHWRLVPWEPGIVTPAEPKTRAEQAERLLRLVSPAIRVEPGFLRDVRRLLGPDGADAGIEADVWQHPAVISTSSVAATLDPVEANRLRREFAKEVKEAKELDDLHPRVLELLRRWRADLPQEIWFEEICSLDPAVQDALVDRRDADEARRFFEQVSRQMEGSGCRQPLAHLDPRD